MSDLAAELHSSHAGLHILWIGQRISLNLDWIEGIRSCEAEASPTSGPHDSG
jgi:hypothetical protein